MIRAAVLTLALVVPGLARAESAYGCTDLAGRHAQAAVEGSGGVFYRLDPDLMMAHPFTDETVSRLADLSAALAARGTRLIYVPLPTKALAMPGALPQAARDHGYDVDLATTVYADLLLRLEAAGVTAVDTRRALLDPGGTAPPFFQTDPRLTPDGAARLARAIAEVMAEVPRPADLLPVRVSVEPAGEVVIDSPWRAQLQRRCLIDLPEVRLAGSRTVRLDPGGGTATLDATGTATAALIGSDLTAIPEVNLAGRLSAEAGVSVLHYAVDGGGAFAGISAYLTSDAYRAAPPAFLIWENPIASPLAATGDAPMAELIAAAGADCRLGLPAGPGAAPGTVTADLTALAASGATALMLETGEGVARSFRFDFRDAEGLVRSRFVERAEGALLTGRVYVPLAGLWDAGPAAVTVTADQPLGAARLSACAG
jgi:alginate biosynthesis protein AlgX